MSELAARALDRLGYSGGPVHRLDARAKLLVCITFVLCVASFPRHEVAEMLPLALFPSGLAALGRVPARPVLRLVLAASPFALLLGAASPFFETAPVGEVFGIPVSGGVLSLISIVLRFALCTSTLLVLVATTPLPRLARALRRLGAPGVVSVQLLLLYRYLFLLLDEGERLSAARLLREPRRRLPRFSTARGMLAMLLGRTLERAQRLYRCLEVRGFEGDLPPLEPERFRLPDALFLVAGVALCLIARLAPLSRWAGALLLARSA